MTRSRRSSSPARRRDEFEEFAHVVAFYDNGVVPIPVIHPVSDKIGRVLGIRRRRADRTAQVDEAEEAGEVPSELNEQAPGRARRT